MAAACEHIQFSAGVFSLQGNSTAAFMLLHKGVLKPCVAEVCADVLVEQLCTDVYLGSMKHQFKSF